MLLPVLHSTISSKKLKEDEITLILEIKKSVEFLIVEENQFGGKKLLGFLLVLRGVIHSAGNWVSENG